MLKPLSKVIYYFHLCFLYQFWLDKLFLVVRKDLVTFLVAAENPHTFVSTRFELQS